MVKSVVAFTKVGMNNTKGGMEINLLLQKNCGVFLVCGTIRSKENYKWFHCFIYDSNYKDVETGCVGRIIDNDPKSGIKIIEEKDRMNKVTARKSLRDMYENRCDIKKVYKIMRK